MGIVGVIPARGGSKGIPDKNIAPCGGRPLICWTCQAALSSTRLDRSIVSTDSERIAQVARECGVSVPFLRPAELALDATPSIDVMLHALNWLVQAGEAPAALVLLQPTSPLRTHRHIDAAVDLYRDSGADTVVSVMDVPHRFHPQSVLVESDGWLLPYQGEVRQVNTRHDLVPLLARNGPAILIVAAEVLRSRRLYGDRVRAYRMHAQDSVDIDAPVDLEYADFLLNRRALALSR